MNRLSIRSLIYAAVSETEGSNSRFTTSQVNGFIDEGVRFLAPILKWPRTMDELTPTAGDATYALTSLSKTFVCLLTAYYGNKNISGDIHPLDIYTEETLAAEFPKWLDASSDARGDPRRIILKDRSNFLIHPTPDSTSAATGKKIHIGYVYLPADISTDASEPELPTNYHDFLVDYGKYKCYSGALENPEEAARILKELMDKSKLVEPLITREFDHQFMTFGNYSDNLDDSEMGINFY